MRKSLSCILSLTLLTPMLLTGCGDEKTYEPRDMEYVQDSEWFDNEVYVTDIYDDKSTVYYNETPVVYADSEQIIFREQFSDNTGEVFVDLVSEYSMGADGQMEKVSSVDLVELGISYEADDGMSGIGPRSIIYFEDELIAIIVEYDYNAQPFYERTYVQVIDLENECLGSIIESESFSSLFENGYPSCIWSEEQTLNVLFNTDTGDWDKYNYQLMKFNSEFELVSQNDFVGYDENYCVHNWNRVDDGHFLLDTFNYNTNMRKWCLLDLDTLVVTEVDDIPNDLSVGSWMSTGQALCGTDVNGISIYNAQTNSIEEILNYNNCNVNRSETSHMRIAYLDQDAVVAWNVCGDGNSIGFRVWKFTRAESNPNVGKSILRLAYLNESYTIGEDVSEAVYEFNENSDSAYIVFDDRYSLVDYMDVDSSRYGYFDYEMTDEYKTAKLAGEVALSNQLRVDIMSGEGPDIIIDGFNYREFNNDNCMMELKELLLGDGGLNADDFLPAVFGYDDEIYQLPLYLSPVGLGWKDTFAEEIIDSYGLSYDEYDSIVEEHCNGKDPISEMNTRNDYMLVLFNNSFDKFIHDGEVDFDNEEFRALAEFASNRLELFTYDSYNYVDNPDARFYGDGWAITIYEINHASFTALPSLSGEEGMTYSCSHSVGIASSCPLVDEAVEFVKVLVDNNPISIDALRTAAEDELARTQQKPEWMSDHEFEYYRCDEEDVERYMDIMTSSSTVYSADSDISVIIYEEMQPYFAGDKTIDEVIPIIEDRCQTVINERG